MIAYVPKANRSAVWPRVAPMIQRALDRSNGTYELEDIERFLMNDTQHLWVAEWNDEIVAAFVTEIVQYPRKKALRLVFGGGAHLHKWASELNEEMEKAASYIGADLIEVHGRMGWLKVLKRLCGAKTETVIMTRAIQ